MTERILEIAETPARLKLDLDCLRVETGDREPVRIPLEDLGLLLLAHPQIQVSAALLQSLASEGVSMLLCDEKRLPVAELLPLQSHSLQSERLARQVAAKEPLRKRLWQQIVQAKLKAQGSLLQRLHGTDAGLIALAAQVRSGDPTNLEGQGARRYWNLLFGDPAFVRDQDGRDQNRLLNYGYAILRSQVTRSLFASGLHPAFGLHHHNRYDAFPLADDLMEPFRPLVDEIVVGLRADWEPDDTLRKEARQALIGLLQGRVLMEGQRLRVSQAILSSTQRLASLLVLGGRGRLVFPEP